MIEKLDINQPMFQSRKSQQSIDRRIFTSNDIDISVHVDYASLIKKAQENPHNDTHLIEKAKELLLSGKLESIENIQIAAKNIIRYGI